MGDERCVPLPCGRGRCGNPKYCKGPCDLYTNWLSTTKPATDGSDRRVLIVDKEIR